MPQLINAQSNQPEEIPHENVQQALTSGTHNLQKGSSVNLLNPDGELVSVPSEQVSDAVQKAQFKFPSSQDVQKYQDQQQYGGNVGNEVAAGVFGAARGASAGISDVLATGPGGLSFGPAGAPTSQVLSKLQEANPDISTATKLGGAIVGSGGATPAGLIAHGGAAISEGAGEAAARALANPERSAITAKILEGATKTGAKALGSSVEGATYGLGQSVSENALGDADLNAENIMHNVGYGALFGAALGGTLGLAGEGYKGAKGAFSKDIEQAALKHSIIENAATSKPVEQYNSIIRNVADEYAATKGLAIDHNLRAGPLSPEASGNIAAAYDAMKHAPTDPKVQQAYSALVKETEDQFNFIQQKTGLKIEPISSDMKNPYANSKDMAKDISQNNHLWFYPTEQGFGSNPGRMNHPLLQPTQAQINGKPLLANDLFRIVHDYFGHAKEMNSFGPKGEEVAWASHKQMFSPDAQKAMTTETRGQNNWVNFGPHGESNRAAPDKTIYADQKAGILPDFAQTMASPPTSMEELSARNKLGAQQGFDTDLPAKNRVLETNEILAGDSLFPAHQLQIQSFEDPTTRLEYKMLMKSDTPMAKDLVQYEANQKAEGVTKLLPKYIQEIAPDANLTDNPLEGGEHAAKSFVDQYEANKKAEAPNFEKIDSVGANLITNPDGILYKIFSDLPGAKDLIGFKTQEGGGYFLKPYDATTGVSDQTYKQLRNLVRALNKEDLTIGGLRNLRDVMGDKIDYLKAPKEAVQLSNMRRNLMDYMQDEVNKAIPDVQVRETMKRYAINEQNREVMEKIFGGSINDKARFGKGIESEKVLDRLFSSRENIAAAKGILGPKFDEIAANYLSYITNKANDPIKGFSTNSVAKLLRSKNLIMEEALSQHPEQLQKINAVIDKMRGLPDSPPGNPSDTASATSLLKKIQGIGSALQHPSQIPGKLLGAIGSHFDAKAQAASLDRQLSSKAQDQVTAKQRMYGAYAKIERMGQQLGKTIDKHVSNIFDSAAAVPGIAAGKLSTKDQYDKTSQQIKDLAHDPEKFMNKLQDSTEALHNIAPNITGSLHVAAARATQFLAGKLPVQEVSSPFNEPHQPSTSDIATFNRYYNVVQNPMSVLQQVKQGTLTKESVEALAVVYPKMYAQMKNAVLEKVTSHTASKVPYTTKLMLSMFTGADLTNSLKQQNIMSAQNVFAQAQPPGPQQGSSSRAKALSKLNPANQVVTDLQRTEQK